MCMVPRDATRLRVLLALFGLLALSPCLLLASNEPGAGQRAPDFAFTDFGGKQHHLSEYSGHYLLLDFWATWCGPCVKEVPILKQAENLYRNRGLIILGLNSDEKVEKAREFLAKKHVSWPQSAPQSTKGITDGALNVKWYPTMILLDPQRRIVFVSGNGKKIFKGKKLLKKLDEILPPAHFR